MGLTPVIIIDLIGLDNFKNVYGFQMVAIGLGRISGPPLIGMIDVPKWLQIRDERIL